MQQIGRPRLGIQAHLLQPQTHPGGDRLGAVRFGDAAVVPQEVQHGQIGDGLPIGEAAPGEVRQAFPRQALAKLVEEPRLAHACLRDNPDHLPLTGLDLRQHLVQHGQVALAAGKPTQGALPQPRSRRPPWPGPEECVGRHRGGHAFDLERRDRLQVHLVLHQSTGGLADEDHPRRGALLEAGGQVRGVAHGRVVHAQVVADTADHHQPRVQPHAHRQVLPRRQPEVGVALAQTVLEPQGRQHCPPGVILIGNGGAKQRHEAVAEELIDGALVPVYRVEAALEEAVEQRMHGLGSQALGQGGRVGNVAEEHRHRLALPFQGAARGEDLLGEMFRGVGERRTVLAAGKGRCRVWNGDLGTRPDQDVALLIDRQALARDEFVLQIVQGRVIELELPLEGAVGQAAAPPQHGNRLVENLLKGHRRPSLCP